MDALQELARVQQTLTLISRHSLSSPDDSAQDLFFAKFLVFLSRNSEDAEDMSAKCTFLARKLQKTPQLFDLTSDLFNDHISKDLCIPKDINTLNVKENNRLDYINHKHNSITLNDMERANSTLEDFCRSYFMFHNLSAENPHEIFQHIPVLSFVESYIYQIDEENEERLYPFTSPLKHEGSSSFLIGAPTPSVSVDNSFKPLEKILKDKNIWTSRIEEELQSGLQYWALEKALCDALLKGQEISMSDVMQAIKLKSFDYRVLNLLLYEILNQPVNELHMDFLSVSELLVEISDDLFDYEEDVLKNSFNILRMFLKINGPIKAPQVLAQVIAETEMEYKKLFDNLEPSLASQYQARCEAAVVEGGGHYSSEHPLGLWTIPSLILDENMYRENVRCSLPVESHL